MSVTSAVGNEDEMRKRITACLLAGDPLVNFDVARQLEGNALNALLASRTWRDRKLGLSDMTRTLDNWTIWSC